MSACLLSETEQATVSFIAYITGTWKVSKKRLLFGLGSKGRLSLLPAFIFPCDSH